MLYNLSYQIVALLFIIGITIHYLITEKFPSRANRYFFLFLVLGIVHNCFDMIGAYTISYSHLISPLVNQVINLIFYNTLLLLPPAFLGYMLVKTEAPVLNHRRLRILLFLPYFVIEGLLLANPFTNMFFYFTASGTYSRGPFYILVLASGFLYIVAAFSTLLKNKKNIRKAEYYALLISLVLMITAVVIQNIDPSVLVIGVGLALSLFTVYLTMQNPCEMLDPTTRVFNNNGFVFYMSERVLSKKPYQFILVKLDDIHIINNMYGSSGGEKLMVNIAKYLQAIAPKGSKIFRKLFDSFVVVTEYESASDFQQLVKKMHAELNALWQAGEYQVQLSTSIAYTFETRFFETKNSAVESFFHAYYALKNRGRGAFSEFDALMIQAMARHDEAEMVLREALENKRIEIHLQPIFSPNEKRFVFAEALARIRTVDDTIIMPKGFIPIAEKNGMIAQVSQQVMEKLFSFIKENDFFQQYKMCHISFNLSAIECEDELLADRILAMLEKYEITPQRLSLEITETSALTSDKLPRLMNTLKDKGIVFMLDDLGSGYANINALLALPFSYVKLSRDTLLKSMSDEKNSFVLAKTVEIIQSLGLKMIAEGAETIEQVDFLHSVGVHYIQGYYYCKPVPPHAFLDIIKRDSFIQ